ncbi:MAG TPA: M1 family aminopeptidase, partial [Gemmataceae bacterium]
DLPARTVDGTATLTFTAMRDLGHVALDAVDFEVQSVRLAPASDGNEGGPGRAFRDVPFRHDGRRLHVTLPGGGWKAGRDGVLAVEYRVRDPKDGLFFFRPTPAEPDLPLTVWSQGEAITNRYWFPCLDHPGEKQTTELVVTVADGFEVLSNGRLVDRRPNGDGTVTFHWKQDKPHVSYLVTLVVGKFAVVKEEWNGKPVLYYVPPEREADVARTFGRTREMLDFFSRRFGIDYPWEKYAQVTVEQFTAGGMENTSATTLTQNSLHDERAALDSDADGLIAHELAHQWWGDLVTCRDWAHLWLNEGFATFAEVIWDEYKRGPDEGAYTLLGKARRALSGGKERPIVDRRYASPRMMFDARAYPKGAWVLHMLRCELGEDAFWKGVRAYGLEHRYQSVETSDFRRTLERVTGRSLERFFYDWTERPGHPVLHVECEYLPETKQVRVAVRQKQPGEPFHFTLPVVVRDGTSAGQARLELRMTEKEQVVFSGPLAEPPSMILIDPDQTVLAEFDVRKGRDLWEAQLLRGPTVAARVRAAEHFGKSKSPRDRELLARALKGEKFWGVRAEIAGALGESGGDVCRDALAAGLAHDDPKTRRACAENLGKFPRDEKAAAALKGLLKKGDPSYFVEAAALSAYAKLEQPDAVSVLLPWLAKPSHAEVLRVAALRGLGDAGDLEALDTLVTWTRRGKPREARTAAMAALAELARTGLPDDRQRRKVLDSLTACLTGKGEMPRVRRAAVSALRSLGQAAEPGVEALEVLVRHDPDEFVRDLARRAIDEIRGNAPQATELKRLREELEKLRRQNRELAERLDRFDKLEDKPGE